MNNLISLDILPEMYCAFIFQEPQRNWTDTWLLYKVAMCEHNTSLGTKDFGQTSSPANNIIPRQLGDP